MTPTETSLLQGIMERHFSHDPTRPGFGRGVFILLKSNIREYVEKHRVTDFGEDPVLLITISTDFEQVSGPENRLTAA
jgi:hypothetical protein